MLMITAVTIVPTSANAVSGVYCSPSQSDTPTPTTSCVTTATSGDRQRGLTWASAVGRRRMRPIAHQVRVAALADALALAIAELATARNTSTQPAPQAPRARKSHGLPSPALGNSANRSGPTAAVAA